MLFVAVVIVFSFFLCKVTQVNSEFHHGSSLFFIVSVLFIFKKTGSFNIACNIFSIAIFVILGKDILVNGGIFSFGNAFLAAIPFVMFIFAKKRYGLIWTFIICLSIIYLYYLETTSLNSSNSFLKLYRPDFQLVGIMLFFVFILGLVFIVSRSQSIIIDELNSKRKILEAKQQELEELKVELITSNKELEVYAQVASHDLKQPLRTISSFGRLLKKELNGSLNERANEYLGFIINESVDMNSMVCEMLDYSKMNSENEVSIEKINTRKLLDNILLKLMNQIKSEDVKIVIDEVPEFIFGQKVRLSQLFQNLISNSIKFKKLDVPLNIKISGMEESDCWHFSIEDNGIGIDPSYHNKIFDMFRRLHTKDSYNGSGIGLATCKKIAKLHKGDIWVNSAVGKGASFQFTISKKLNFLN